MFHSYSRHNDNGIIADFKKLTKQMYSAVPQSRSIAELDEYRKMDSQGFEKYKDEEEGGNSPTFYKYYAEGLTLLPDLANKLLILLLGLPVYPW